jgi:GNAT superfamily N-acetyltransferase
VSGAIVDGVRAEFTRYRTLGEKALQQVDEADLSRPGPGGGNSLATLVWHISGNLRSRFTDFRTSDGEKPWRRRDEEFVERPVGREEVQAKWDAGWLVLFAALDDLTDADLTATITIRAEPMTMALALQRSVTHTAYHVGQIVYLAKAWRGSRWSSLSIPVGMSEAVNRRMGYAPAVEAFTVEAVSPASAEAQSLIAELDAELQTRYPGLPAHGLRDRDLVNPLTRFVVGRLDGRPVACGATRRLADDVAEIKRMYVTPPARGRGLSKQILAALEDDARRAGVTRLLLETGDRQPEAISLYKSAGYEPVAPYGEFKDSPQSRCFEKRLDGT